VNPNYENRLGRLPLNSGRIEAIARRRRAALACDPAGGLR
jgi:hypothetical protein